MKYCIKSNEFYIWSEPEYMNLYKPYRFLSTFGERKVFTLFEAYIYYCKHSYNINKHYPFNYRLKICVNK